VCTLFAKVPNYMGIESETFITFFALNTSAYVCIVVFTGLVYVIL